MISDIVMPEMSGQELARRIATDRGGMKVLFMSGYTEEAVRRHGILESGTAFVTKPIPMDALLRKIRELL